MIGLRKWSYRNEAEEGADGGGGVVDDKTPAKDDGESGEPAVSPEIIAKAERMGWTPKDQFRGDPDKWRPADEFVERGENMIPLLRSQVKRQERQIDELSRTVKEFAEYTSKADQRARERALAELKEARAAAIKAGDGDTFDKVDEAITELREQIKPKAAQKTEQPGEDLEFTEWLSRNKWANEEDLQHIGLGISNSIARQHPDATRIEVLDMVAKEVKRRFPERFENPRRNAAPAVEGGAPPRKSGGRGFADLPADARAACERMARNAFEGKPEEIAKFKADYVKNFFAD